MRQFMKMAPGRLVRSDTSSDVVKRCCAHIMGKLSQSIDAALSLLSQTVSRGVTQGSLDEALEGKCC